MNRKLAVLAVFVLAVVIGYGLPQTSDATFTASTSSRATVAAAADWTPPTVSVQDPGSPLKGTVTVAATATDGESGVADVTIDVQSVTGATWTPLCVDSSAPYSCSWSTTSVADGSYRLRARATDRAGYSSVSTSVETVVANNLLVVLDDPGAVLRGTAPLTARVHNPGPLALTLRIEYAVAGTTTWRTICTGLTTTLTCGWATTALATQEYDLRAVALVGAGTYTSPVVPDVLVDNAAPTVTMQDPGSPLRGTVTLAATASDAHAGVASLLFQYAVTGSTTWQDACTALDPATSCRFDTTRIADASYSFRAVATDYAGNSASAAPVANRLVDNTVSAVAVEDPGAFLNGVVTVTATASSTAGIVSVRLQRTAAGGSTWTDVCTDTTAPYSCTWDTTTVPDGLHDLRAILVDGLGRTTISATLASRRVDNSPLRARDVQAVNGGATAGKLDTGDQLIFTYSSQVNPASVTSGWTGTALPVTLRLRDGNVLGLGGRSDTVDVLRSGATVNLGSVNLNQEYAKPGKTITFNATMVASTVTVSGVPATTVTLTLGAVASGTGLRGGNPAAMVWTPSAAVTDTTGRACAVAPATETGALDRDF